MMLDFPGPRHSRFSLRCRGGVQLEQPGGEQVDGDDISIMYNVHAIYSIKISCIYIYIHTHTITHVYTQVSFDYHDIYIYRFVMII